MSGEGGPSIPGERHETVKAGFQAPGPGGRTGSEFPAQGGEKGANSGVQGGGPTPPWGARDHGSGACWLRLPTGSPGGANLGTGKNGFHHDNNGGRRF